MNHFNIWQWADYARGLSGEIDRAAMDAHLSSGCARCARTANTFRSVAAVAGAEVGNEPPEHAIRYARAAYSLFRPETTSLPRLLARLVHDTMSEALPAGIRAQSALSRHALYEAGNYYLDLQLDLQQASGPVTLVGQLADRSNPSADVAVPVWLMHQKRVLASTLCDRFGEFQLEYTPARDLWLHLPLRKTRNRLEIPLSRLTPEIPRALRPPTARRRKTAKAIKRRNT